MKFQSIKRYLAEHLLAKSLKGATVQVCCELLFWVDARLLSKHQT